MMEAFFFNWNYLFSDDFGLYEAGKITNLDMIILLEKLLWSSKSQIMKPKQSKNIFFYFATTSVHRQTFIRLVEFQFQNKIWTF